VRVKVVKETFVVGYIEELCGVNLIAALVRAEVPERAKNQ